jgi:succinate dehydrogenase/fumarate reductase iron-sulfur protein
MGAVDKQASPSPSGTVIAKVFRFDPSTDAQPRFEIYQVPASPQMRVLDVLNYIGEDLGIGLGHRWLCGVKKCGTCTVRVNGRETLACWEPALPEMVIEPLRHAEIIRDLVVDRSPYEARVMKMRPKLERREPYQGFPEHLSDRHMRPAQEAVHCISCMACYSACPVLDLGDRTGFVGPAPLVQLAQTALDPRDGKDSGRIVAEHAEIFSCVSCYKCEEVCPADIRIVSDVIEPLKALAYASAPERYPHQKAFLEIINGLGQIDPSALVLKTQGLKSLRQLGRIWKLWRRGKIDPIKTFFGKRPVAAEAMEKINDKAGGPLQ